MDWVAFTVLRRLFVIWFFTESLPIALGIYALSRTLAEWANGFDYSISTRLYGARQHWPIVFAFLFQITTTLPAAVIALSLNGDVDDEERRSVIKLILVEYFTTLVVVYFVARRLFFVERRVPSRNSGLDGRKRKDPLPLCEPRDQSSFVYDFTRLF